MYIIKKQDRRFGKKEFHAYEDARSYVRKYMRKNKLDLYALHHNPCHSHYGFTIVKHCG